MMALTFQAVQVLLGNKTEWIDVKRDVNNAHKYIEQLLKFDPNTVSEEQRQECQRILAEIDCEKVPLQSRAAGVLLEWLQAVIG